MKTRTQTRTPKRLLSVFLSILMLMSSFVFVNPVVSEAAERVVFDASKYGNYKKNAFNVNIDYKQEVVNDSNSYGPNITLKTNSSISGSSGAVYKFNADPNKPHLTRNINDLDFSRKTQYDQWVGKCPVTFDQDKFSIGARYAPTLYAFYDYRSGVTNTSPTGHSRTVDASPTNFWFVNDNGHHATTSRNIS